MQISKCQEYITMHGGQVTEIYQDDFRSGSTLDRVGMQQIMDDIRSPDRKWENLIVLRMDRLSRSLRDFLDLFDLFAKHNVAIVSIHEKIDFSTPWSRAGMQVLCVFSELYRAQACQAVKEKMTHMATKEFKFITGKPPHGYQKSKDKNKKNTLDVVPNDADEVRDIFKRYAEGQSVDQINRVYPHIKVNRICHMLRNLTYTGKILWAHKDYPGVHTPIVDQLTFARVQSRLPNVKSAPRPNAQKRPYFLSGIFFCRCKRAMCPESASYSTGPKRYPYYVCKDTMRCRTRINADKAEKAVLEAIQAAPANQELIEKLVAGIKQQQHDAQEKSRLEMERIESELAETRRQLDSIHQAFAKGLVTSENAEYLNSELSKNVRAVEQLEAQKNEFKPQLTEWNFAKVSVEGITKNLTALNERLASAANNPKLFKFFLQKAIRRIIVTCNQKERRHLTVRIELNPINNDKVTLDLDARILRH